MVIYHGSSREIIKPLLEQGNPHNDFGKGFYCSTKYDTACQWACKNNSDGCVNMYELDKTNLLELNLSDGTHSILEWIAVLLNNRSFTITTPLAEITKSYILQNFLPSTNGIDLITGLRADDSYFCFVEGFISNSIPLEVLVNSINKTGGNLQTALISQVAFNKLSFVSSGPAEKDIYYPLITRKDLELRQNIFKASQLTEESINDLYAIDFLRQKIRKNDERLQSTILR